MKLLVFRSRSFGDTFSGASAFDELMALQGELYRNVADRQTLRFERNGRSYFIKIHRGVGWREIFKNLFQLRLPVLGAKNEWLAIERLEQLGVETMKTVAYGCRGQNPAQLQSFIVTEDLQQTESLEDFCACWPTEPPPLALKRALIRRVAEMARRLHENGVNHRDFYICHFLLRLPVTAQTVSANAFHLYLIDLHRVQLRRRTPRRWLVKDIAGLYFSSMDIGLTRRDYLRFMALYRNMPLRQLLRDETQFWRRVEKRATQLYQSAHGRPPKSECYVRK